MSRSIHYSLFEYRPNTSASGVDPGHATYGVWSKQAASP